MGQGEQESQSCWLAAAAMQDEESWQRKDERERTVAASSVDRRGPVGGHEGEIVYGGGDKMTT